MKEPIAHQLKDENVDFSHVKGESDPGSSPEIIWINARCTQCLDAFIYASMPTFAEREEW